MNLLCISRTCGIAIALFSLLSPLIGQAESFDAEKWQANAWGGAIYEARTSAACTQGGVNGYYFQKDSRATGDVEVTLPSVLKPSRAYQLTLWLKAVKGNPTVDVFFRRDGAHFETAAIKTMVSTSSWSLVKVQGIYTLPTNGSVRLALQQVGTAVCISGAKLDEIDSSNVGYLNSAPAVRTRFFGTHLNQLGRHQAWPNFNPGLIRLWDTGTTWADLQPVRGPINWSGPRAQRLELFVRHVEKNNPGGALLLTIGMTPAWAGSTHPKRCNDSSYGHSICTAPLNMEDWRAYVREVAKRYSGRIKYWEIWNETDIWVHWDDTPQKMVEIVRVAYEELKAADPENIVMGPNITTNGLRFLNNFLEAGGGKYIDAVSVHAYFFRDPERALGSLRNVRETLTAKGLSLPIWNTETGVGCDPDEPLCAAQASTLRADVAIAQSMVGSAALGVENFGYYTWEGAGSEGLVGPDFSMPTSQGLAYTRVRRWIDGAKLSNLPVPVKGVTLIKAIRNDAIGYIAWSTQEHTQIESSLFVGATRCQSLAVRSDKPIPTAQVIVGAEPIICMDDKFVFDDRWAK